jgi:hypothetical protein
MVQEVGVEVGIHHFHQLEAQMYLLKQPLADLFAGSQCLVVLISQTSEPLEISRRLGSSSIPRNLRSLLFCRTNELWPFEWC